MDRDCDRADARTGTTRCRGQAADSGTGEALEHYYGEVSSFERRLATLFPPKQRELVLKRFEGLPFTKTEREYYSRVVRKKLEAIADSRIHDIAVTLCRGVSAPGIGD